MAARKHKPKPNSHPKANKRGPAELQQDLVDISRLYLEQKTQRQMVVWIKENRPYTLCLKSINDIIKKVLAMWHASATANINEAKERDLARLLDIERHATEAFEKSKLPAETTIQEQTTEDSTTGKPRIKASVKRENRDGDPRWMEIILKCIAERKDILGYQAPKKLDFGGEDGALKISVEVQSALEIAYGNTRSNEQQNGGTLATVRAIGGGPWSPPKPV